jgi:hypothetical protein
VRGFAKYAVLVIEGICSDADGLLGEYFASSFSRFHAQLKLTCGTTYVLTNFKSDLLLSTNNKKGVYVK